MANKLILVYTPVLIDLFRKTDKTNSVLVSLVRKGHTYCISSVTDYEIYIGASLGQIDYWDKFLEKIEVLPFYKKVSKIAVELNKKLKRKRKLIDITDLFIAAAAISNNILLATLNAKHFERIESLDIIK
jgi:predicted nucleic acid-binding protein